MTVKEYLNIKEVKAAAAASPEEKRVIISNKLDTIIKPVMGQAQQNARSGLPTCRSLSTSSNPNGQCLNDRYQSVLQTDHGGCFGDPLPELKTKEDLLNALCEVMVRFDTDPDHYTKSDYYALITALSNGLIHLYLEFENVYGEINDLNDEVDTFDSRISENLNQIQGLWGQLNIFKNTYTIKVANLDTTDKQLDADIKAETTRAVGVETNLNKRLVAVEKIRDDWADKIAQAKNEAINTAEATATNLTQQALAAAKNYSDEKIQEAKNYTDTQVAASEEKLTSNIDGIKTELLNTISSTKSELQSSSQTYTDTKVAETLASAKEHTDTEIKTTKEFLSQEIQTAVSSVLKFKGSLAKKANLDSIQSPVIGDVYHIQEDQSEYVYTGEKWELLGLSVDLSPYAEKTSLESHTGDSTIHITAQERSTWDAKATTNDVATAKTEAITEAKTYTDDLVASVDVKSIFDKDKTQLLTVAENLTYPSAAQTEASAVLKLKDSGEIYRAVSKDSHTVSFEGITEGAVTSEALINAFNQDYYTILSEDNISVTDAEFIENKYLWVGDAGTFIINFPENLAVNSFSLKACPYFDDTTYTGDAFSLKIGLQDVSGNVAVVYRKIKKSDTGTDPVLQDITVTRSISEIETLGPIKQISIVKYDESANENIAYLVSSISFDPILTDGSRWGLWKKISLEDVDLKDVIIPTEEYAYQHYRDEQNNTLHVLNHSEDGKPTSKGFTQIKKKDDFTEGQYLIISISNSKAYVFNPNLTKDTIDNNNNFITRDLENGSLVFSEDLNEYAFQFSGIDDSYKAGIRAYIKSNLDYYITNTSSTSNKITCQDTPVDNYVTFNENGTVDIASATASTLKFNSQNSANRFRYYKTTSTTTNAIILYKLDGTTTSSYKWDKVVRESELVPVAKTNSYESLNDTPFIGDVQTERFDSLPIPDPVQHANIMALLPNGEHYSLAADKGFRLDFRYFDSEGNFKEESNVSEAALGEFARKVSGKKTFNENDWVIDYSVHSSFGEGLKLGNASSSPGSIYFTKDQIYFSTVQLTIKRYSADEACTFIIDITDIEGTTQTIKHVFRDGELTHTMFIECPLSNEITISTDLESGRRGILESIIFGECNYNDVEFDCNYYWQNVCDSLKGDKGDSGAVIIDTTLDHQDAEGGNVYKQTFDDGSIQYFTAPRGIQGVVGPQGPVGDPFAVAKTYSSIAEMQADTSDDVKNGGFVLISTESVDDEDNGKLYVKNIIKTQVGETITETADWRFLCDLSGAQGITGQAATIEVGTVTTEDAGSQASVSNSGTAQAAVFDFTIPKGDQGTAAGFGEPTATISSADFTENPTVSVTTSGEDTAKVFTFDFKIPKGADALYYLDTWVDTRVTPGSAPQYIQNLDTDKFSRVPRLNDYVLVNLIQSNEAATKQSSLCYYYVSSISKEDGSITLTYKSSVYTQGVDGPTGTTGNTGNGIKESSVTYAVSNQGTDVTKILSSDWKTDPIEVSSTTPYAWTKLVLTFSNGNTQTLYSVTKQGETPSLGVNKTVTLLNPTATSGSVTSTTNDQGVTEYTFSIPKGEKGDTGDPFRIKQVFTTVEAMNDALITSEVGDMVQVSNTDLEEHGWVYSKVISDSTSDPVTYEWKFTADMSGVQGIQGPSAYQVAVNNGYVGTETEWLASLKGDTGDTPTGSVLYNTKQSLTEAQKAQARENIGITDSITEIEDKLQQRDVYQCNRVTSEEWNSLTEDEKDTSVRYIVTTDDKDSLYKSKTTVTKTIDNNSVAYVDLGLKSGTLWATTNVGAIDVTDLGGKYAWGETETKEVYTLDTYLAYDVETQAYTKYAAGESLVLTDDVANVTLGGTWQIPTVAMWNELQNSCIWTLTTVNEISGYEIAGSNGNTIFLPGITTSLDDKVQYWTNKAETEENIPIRYMTSERQLVNEIAARYTGSYVRSALSPTKVSTTTWEEIEIIETTPLYSVQSEGSLYHYSSPKFKLYGVASEGSVNDINSKHFVTATVLTTLPDKFTSEQFNTYIIYNSQLFKIDGATSKTQVELNVLDLETNEFTKYTKEGSTTEENKENINYINDITGDVYVWDSEKNSFTLLTDVPLDTTVRIFYNIKNNNPPFTTALSNALVAYKTAGTYNVIVTDATSGVQSTYKLDVVITSVTTDSAGKKTCKYRQTVSNSDGFYYRDFNSATWEEWVSKEYSTTHELGFTLRYYLLRRIPNGYPAQINDKQIQLTIHCNPEWLTKHLNEYYVTVFRKRGQYGVTKWRASYKYELSKCQRLTTTYNKNIFILPITADDLMNKLFSVSDGYTIYDCFKYGCGEGWYHPETDEYTYSNINMWRKGKPSHRINLYGVDKYRDATPQATAYFGIGLIHKTGNAKYAEWERMPITVCQLKAWGLLNYNICEYKNYLLN